MKKKSETFKGYTCADCKRNVVSVYAKSIAKKQVMYVCWACISMEEE